MKTTQIEEKKTCNVAILKNICGPKAIISITQSNIEYRKKLKKKKWTWIDEKRVLFSNIDLDKRLAHFLCVDNIGISLSF